MRQNRKSTNSFFRELRRRKVTQTCVLYAIVCWGLLQVGDILYPALGLDADKASLNFLYLAIAGFPATFAVAWFLQITPQGIVRTSSFIEQRVLNNIPPLNDRRKSSLSKYSNAVEGRAEQRWVLTAETGPLAGLFWGVDQPILLGRSLSCDIALVSPQISREHARLDFDDDQLMIEDLGSSNGTIVNGKKVDGRTALHNEDELRMNDFIFRVTETFSVSRSEIETMKHTTLIARPKLPPDE
jgi:hypothetical protein